MRGSRRANAEARTIASAPPAVSANGSPRVENAAAALHMSAAPSATSTAPPRVIKLLSPSAGRPTWTAKNTPAIAPTVLAAYTTPTLASPWPRRRRWKVMSGRVVPAQKVAGSMIARARPLLARLKSA